MTFTTIQELRDYIIATFTANGVRDITGPEAQDAFIGILDLLTPQLTQELIVSVGAGKVGGAVNGRTFASGTSVEAVLRAILREAVPPTYTLPTVALNSSVTTLDHEIGSVINPIFSFSFVQNDGGAKTGQILRRNGTSISTTLPYQDASFSLIADAAYQVSTPYAQGACKNDSLGSQSCTGRVQPATASSNTITYRALRKLMWGTPVIALTNSSTVRSGLSQGSLNPQVGTQFSINIPASSLNVAFAYPSSLPAVTSVKLGGIEIKGLFAESLINVEGANGATAVEYRVYVFTPIEAFSTSTNYEVTI